MANQNTLTKTDFLLYLESPLHLWAAKHDQLEISAPTSFQMLLINQGQEVEEFAKVFMINLAGDHELIHRPDLIDGMFKAQPDFLLHERQTDVFDLYEVKSSTSIKMEHEYDLAFQALVCAATLTLRDVYLVLVNKGYTRRGEIEPQALFTVENMTEKVTALQVEVAALRDQALEIIQQEKPDGLQGCADPDTCPCPILCHPNLPTQPIYDLPRIGKKALDLQRIGVTAIENIPPNYPLNKTQRAYIELVQNGKPKIDVPAIRQFLSELEYPLFFLDYETVNPALPLYDGHHPYDLVVFQFSLQVVEQAESQPKFHELLVLDPLDPAPQMASRLQESIGPSGSVLAWNKSFEARCNQTIARLVPEYREFFDDITERLVDLMDVFKLGYYLHPDFRGSASLKNVLPVLVPELTYENLSIGDGSAAMLAWWELVFGDIEPGHRDALESALRAYSQQDAAAMVAIWKVLEDQS